MDSRFGKMPAVITVFFLERRSLVALGGLELDVQLRIILSLILLPPSGLQGCTTTPSVMYTGVEAKVSSCQAGTLPTKRPSHLVYLTDFVIFIVIKILICPHQSQSRKSI